MSSHLKIYFPWTSAFPFLQTGAQLLTRPPSPPRRRTSAPPSYSKLHLNEPPEITFSKSITENTVPLTEYSSSNLSCEQVVQSTFPRLIFDHSFPLKTFQFTLFKSQDIQLGRTRNFRKLKNLLTNEISATCDWITVEFTNYIKYLTVHVSSRLKWRKVWSHHSTGICSELVAFRLCPNYKPKNRLPWSDKLLWCPFRRKKAMELS